MHQMEHVAVAPPRGRPRVREILMAAGPVLIKKSRGAGLSARGSGQNSAD